MVALKGSRKKFEKSQAPDPALKQECRTQFAEHIALWFKLRKGGSDSLKYPVGIQVQELATKLFEEKLKQAYGEPSDSAQYRIPLNQALKELNRIDGYQAADANYGHMDEITELAHEVIKDVLKVDMSLKQAYR